LRGKGASIHKKYSIGIYHLQTYLVVTDPGIKGKLGQRLHDRCHTIPERLPLLWQHCCFLQEKFNYAGETCGLSVYPFSKSPMDGIDCFQDIYKDTFICRRFMPGIFLGARNQ